MTDPSTPALVFSTERYEPLRARICERQGVMPGEIETRTFSDGERYYRIATRCEGRDVALVGGTISEADTMAVYDIACGIVSDGARSLTLVIPYFGYQTMERAVRPGEVVTAKTRAQLLSAIPAASEGNRVVLVDVHSPGIPYYFDAHVRPVHLDTTAVVLDLIRSVGGDDFVLGATDAGRAKWVEQLANMLDVDAAFLFKRRLGDARTEVAAMAADVRDRRVILYDDMIRSGSTLLTAARAYLQAGARGIAAVSTHGVLPGDAVDKLRDSGLLETLACTDTHPRALELRASSFLRVASVAEPIGALLTEGPGGSQRGATTLT